MKVWHRARQVSHTAQLLLLEAEHGNNPSLSGFAGICQLFEEKLKILNPGMRTLEYNIDDLFTFIDSHVSTIFPSLPWQAVPRLQLLPAIAEHCSLSISSSGLILIF